MVETSPQNVDSRFPRRDALKSAALVIGAVVGFRQESNIAAQETRQLKKEGVQLVDREIQGMTLEAHFNPFIDRGTLRLHVCIEDQGTADLTSRQLNEVDGIQPGYLVIGHEFEYADSCFDANAVTGQALGEIDEVLIGTNDSEKKHVFQFTRDVGTGELTGQYIGEEIVDLTKIRLRDNATPQP